MDWGARRVETVDLGYDQMWLIEAQPQARMRVLYGGVWLTEQGHYQDVIVGGAEEVVLQSRGAALVQALAPSRVQLIEYPGRWQRMLIVARTAMADRLAAAASALRPAAAA